MQLELIAAVLSTRRRKMFLSYPTLHPSLDLDLVISLDYHPGPSEARRINYSVVYLCSKRHANKHEIELNVALAPSGSMSDRGLAAPQPLRALRM